MGVEFQHAGNTHYGWALLQISDSAAFGAIDSWAWDTRPDTPILAGAGIDSDGDGVPDYLDQCPETPAGAVVDAEGCSIDQHCPCNGPWKNHGEYVKTVKSVAGQFRKERRITKAEQKAIGARAAQSDCGKGK